MCNDYVVGKCLECGEFARAYAIIVTPDKFIHNNGKCKGEVIHVIDLIKKLESELKNLKQELATPFFELNEAFNVLLLERKQLKEALEYAKDIIEAYESEIRSSGPGGYFKTDLVGIGFCQGKIFKEARDKIDKLSKGD